MKIFEKDQESKPKYEKSLFGMKTEILNSPRSVFCLVDVVLHHVMFVVRQEFSCTAARTTELVLSGGDTGCPGGSREGDGDHQAGWDSVAIRLRRSKHVKIMSIHMIINI